MDTVNFKKELLEAQSELQRFAYKLTNDKEEANDLLQETSLKALVNIDKYEPTPTSKGGCLQLCATSLSIITARCFANRPL